MKTKRILSIALTLVMLLGMLPGMNLTAYAANNLTIYIMDMLENMDDNEWGYQLYDGDVSIAEGTYVQINMGTWHTGVMNIYMNGEVVYTKPSGSLYKDDVYHFTAGPNCKILGGYQNMFDWDGNPNVYITQDASVAVTGVTLNPNTAQTIDVGGSVAFTATVEPAGASDKTVKWSVGGTNADAVKLYSDSACTTEVGADATDKLTVYAKGESAGSATVTATSNADSTKSASCDVTVNAAQTQTEELLTTITAVGASNASTATSANVSYSTEDIATLTFSQVTPDGYGRVSYVPTWGWWGYGITLTVTPADGYTITKCVFYDDANRTATDSEAPFVVETAEEGDKAPKVNGTPILAYTSKGIKKIEVYGYATPTATHSVTITPGDNMTKTAGSGDAEQTGLSGAMTDVVYTADDGYYFPTDYSVAEVSGIKVTRDSYTQITVSGTPTADATITLTAPTAKKVPATDDFHYSDPGPFEYDGEPKAAYVEPDATRGVVGMGEITVHYYSDSSCTTTANPTDAGTYYVGITVTEGDAYKAVSTVLHDASWQFTINRASQIAPAAPTKAGATINSITLTAIANGEYKRGDGEWQTDPTFTGLAMNTEYTFYQRLKEDGNHNASPSSTSATISTNDHVHEWSYEANGATITATCADTDGGHGETKTATLTIAAPTLTTYGGEGSAAATLTGLEAFNSATDLTVAASDIKYYGVEEYEIEGHTYKKQGDELAQVPTAAGEYVAGLTLSNVKTSETETGDVIARVWYTIAPASISSVTVTDITAPVATEALDTEAATSTANVTLGAVTWNPTTTPAAYATQYTATVIATAAANYAFADTVTATVNGQAATVTKNDGGTLTIAYTFEKTALTPVTITATDKKADWSADGIAIPVEGMFTITEGAGAATYTVTNGTGEGTYDAQTGKLTVTKCGTFTVKVSTAATDTYAAGAETTATLTVNKVDSTAATVTANTLIYTGSAQALVTVTGEATGGTMQYALGTKDAATEEYTPSIPTGTDAGTYYVWYKVVGDANHNDSAAVCVTASIQRRSSGGGSSTTTVTVPVTSDTATGSVPVTASVSGTTATVTKLTDEQITQVTTNKSGNKDADAETETNSVVIDVSGVAKDVKTATIPTETVKAVEETGSNLKVTLTDGSVEFDATAQAIITDEAKGTTIQVNLDAVKVTTLTSAQQSAVESLEVEVVLDAYVTSNGQRISDFKGGSATLSVPYTLKDGQTAQGIVVWYVASDGTRTQVPATYDGKNVVFTVPHFSNYVIAYDAEQAKVCPKDATCPIGKFSDASASAWYHDGVHWALENGVMNGVGNGKFAPNDTTTRAQVVTMLWRLEGSPAYVGMSEFSDVDNEEWYGPAIRWASAEGIVNGYDDGRFGANDAVTREQLVTILYRYAQYKKMDVSVGEDTNILSYDDAFDVSEWAIPAMQWACGSGIVNGIDKDGKLVLAPADSSTRAVVATMLWRFSK